MLSPGRLRKGSILGIFVFGLMIFADRAAADEKIIHIAILPCKDVVMNFKKFHPLAGYLEQETGLNVKVVVPEDLKTLEKDLRNGDIDFAFQDPYTYVELSKLYHPRFLLKAVTREGRTNQSGLVIVRKDSGIRNVVDLKGKTVMFGPKLSATTFMIAKLLFREKGVDVDQDLRAYSHGKCCEDIAFHVYLKSADAGVVCDHFFEEHSDMQQELGIDPEAIMIIDRTKEVPMNVFSANLALSDDFIRRIDQALLRLDKEKSSHAKVLYPAELGGFEQARDEEYDDIRRLIHGRN